MEKIKQLFSDKKVVIGVAFCAAVLIATILMLALPKRVKEGLQFSSEQPAEPKMLYGINIDTLDVEEGYIGKNQYLSTILHSKGVSYQTIDMLSKNRKTFDPRRIKKGNKYSFLLTRDSVPEAVYFVYEIDNINYAVFGLRDSIAVWLGQKEIDTIRETACGTITSSLWNSMIENGYDINLSLRMSEIFAWTIDFFGIQKNDEYAIIYDRMYIDSTSVGIGNIYAACFKHSGSNQYAFFFDGNGKSDFYDENGQNLRKAFLKAPLNYSRISSKFTGNRYHPVLKIYRPHHGVDYAAPAGTPVVAIGDGTITKKGFQAKGGGNYLYIKHNSTYTTCYMHLKGYAKGIKQGVKVKQGQVIGYVGSTGIATGPHLDFRVYKNGNPIDPLKMKSPSAESVRTNDMEKFKQYVEPFKAQLDGLISEKE